MTKEGDRSLEDIVKDVLSNPKGIIMTPSVNQFCDAHTDLVQAVGRVEGRQGVVIEQLGSIHEKLDKLTANGVINKQAIEIERQKIKPIYWVLAIIGGTITVAVINKAIVIWVGH